MPTADSRRQVQYLRDAVEGDLRRLINALHGVGPAGLEEAHAGATFGLCDGGVIAAGLTTELDGLRDRACRTG